MYFPTKVLGKEKLMKTNKPSMDSTLCDGPSCEIKKGQIRGTNQFEIENVILCEKVYKGRIG